MSHSAAISFLARVDVFDRGEYAAALGLDPADPAVGAMLGRHVRERRIRHFAGGVYGTVPPGRWETAIYPVSPYLVAPRLRPGSVLAYHSALNVHGFTYHLTHCILHAFSPAGREELAIAGFFYDFLDPAPGIVLGGEDPADGIEILSYLGCDIRVTTFERTMADLFDRPVMGGDGLIESLDFADGADSGAMVRHMRTLGNPAAAGAVGFWLESRRDRHRVDEADLAALRDMAPVEPVYALDADPGDGLLVDGWNVILPRRFVVPDVQGYPL